MHIGAHVAVAYLAFSWAEPTSVAASLAGSVLPDVQFIPVQIDAAVKRAGFHQTLGRWRRNKVFRSLDFALQSPILSLTAFLGCLLWRAALPDWALFFTFNWFLHVVEDVLTHKTADLKRVEIAWPVAWPFSSKVSGFGVISEHESKLFPKIEIAVMLAAVMVFLVRTFY